MDSAAAKLQLKPGEKLRVVNAPRDVDIGVPTTTAASADAILVFAANAQELAKHSRAAVEAARADRLSWIAYPKAGQLGTDLSRDRLWKLLEPKGIRPVRQIALDEVWSALRFRPAR